MALQEHGEVREGGLPRRREDLEPAGTGRMGSTFYRWRFAPAQLPVVLEHDWSLLGRRACVDSELGEVTLMVPSGPRENMSRRVGHLVAGAAAQHSIPCEEMGATTWSPPGSSRVEADESFYLGEAALRYRELEDGNEWAAFAGANPPQLVVEVERTHGDSGKPDVYRALGVIEMWRIDRSRDKPPSVEILELQHPVGWRVVGRSTVLPGLASALIVQVLETARRQGAGSIPGLLASAGISRKER